MPATASVLLDIDVTVPVAAAPKGPWRFLYGPAQPKGGATAEVVQAQNKTLVLRTEPDQNHEASFDIDGRSPQAAGIVELQTDLTVMYGSNIMFQGRIVPTQDTLDASSHRTVVTAYDYREVLRRRAVLPGDTLSWTSVDAGTIVWNMIQATQGRAGGNLGIARGKGQTTGIPRIYTIAVGDYIGDDITALCQMANGFEWQITPYGLADLRLDLFVPAQGTDQGVVLSYGDGRVSGITRTVDPSTFADCVYVTGGTGTTPEHIEDPAIGTRPEQRWDSVIGTTYITQTTLHDHTLDLLNQAQVVTPSYQIQCYPGTWGGPQDIWLGDPVTVRINSGRLQVDDPGLRVVEMAFAINPDNVEVLTLTVGQVPFRVHRKIASILKRLQTLERR